MLFKKIFWQSLVLGTTFIATISPSQAETTKTAESDPTSSPLTEVTNSPTFQAVEENIVPLEISGLEVLEPTVSADLFSQTNSQTNTDSSNPSGEVTPEETNSSEPQTTTSDSKRWHFLIQPYIYLPITI
jgi:hypothetical protein